ncbi:hypothetical protein KC19_7G182400 [Ceratodon purpureus]|uniref:Secreted protein n=1 Tax=Ceratodon purpureus TaxID=3225 RepID=A0A8T0HC99_CERPU|nr:hypothetical protein KC19_7G182400 [Ceratodon purpureus]
MRLWLRAALCSWRLSLSPSLPHVPSGRALSSGTCGSCFTLDPFLPVSQAHSSPPPPPSGSLGSSYTNLA